jgi:hypothetical protein
MHDNYSEWAVIEKLLPSGWREKARELGAFKKPTYLKDPAVVLRLLLLYAANDAGTRDTVAQAAAAGLGELSGVALLKRLRNSGEWLRWIASALCKDMQAGSTGETWGLTPRAIDGTCVQGPASTRPEWRVHYSLNLTTFDCDWHEVTSGKVSEGLERVPVKPGDVLIGDRNFLTHRGAKAVTDAGGHVLVRLRWSHPKTTNENGDVIHALELARGLRPNEAGEWSALLTDPKTGNQIPGRIVALRLSHPLAQKAAERRARKQAKKNKSKRPDPRSIDACKYVLIFTTLPTEKLSKKHVLELYRHRWQIELAFKRHKQILGLGRLPHKRPDTAIAWILAKFVLALLLEKLHRNAMLFSPWGYDLST